METKVVNMNEDYEKVSTKEKVGKIIGKIITYIFLAFCAIIVIFPFYWMVLTSIKSFESYSNEVVPKFYAIQPTLENYVSAVTEYSLARFMLNTVIYSICSTALMVVICILAAFAFARLEFKGRNILFTAFLALMIIPNELVIITNYVTIVNLDLRNTYVGLVLPSIMSVFYVYLLRQNFMQVPDDIYYAAKVDGTSDFKYLWKVLVPLSKPTIISIVILKIIECWNSYVWPRLITTEASHYLVSNAIQDIKENGFGRSNIPAMMAAVVIVSIPLLVIYLIFRKQIMAGVSRSGLKG